MPLNSVLDGLWGAVDDQCTALRGCLRITSRGVLERKDESRSHRARLVDYVSNGSNMMRITIFKINMIVANPICKIQVESPLVF